MLHAARTGKTITALSAVSRFRSDPFYKSRPPRSIICLPISLQGQQQGVVLLSSDTIASTQSQWESAKEVVATLATFATIITSNVSFTKRLKLEVDQRTQELQNALAAKTQFLSQCSHELRSPLSAVLVSCHLAWLG
jgi:GAF domain-containing protein